MPKKITEKKTTDSSGWERHKDAIYRYYITEDKSLKDVASLMVERHGFDKTKSQYERAFKHWNWRKNLTSQEWEYVVHRVKNKPLGSKPNVDAKVQLHGLTIPSKKVKKELWRHGHRSVFEHLQQKNGVWLRPRTPPGIVIEFPSSPHGNQALTNWRMEPPSKSALHICARSTPWLQFVSLTETLRQPASIDLFTVPQTSSPLKTEVLMHLDHDLPDINQEVVELVPRKIHSPLETFQYELAEALFIDFDQEGHLELSAMGAHSNSFLPPTAGKSSNIDIMAVLDLTHRSSQLEFLKLAVSLISNNLHDTAVKGALVELCRQPRNLVFFRNLLEQRLPSFDAVAEKLLPPAAYHGNLELVTMLVEYGVEINLLCPYGLPMNVYYGTALLAAIETDRKEVRIDLVKYLLDHGADPFFADPFFNCSLNVLHTAVLQGDINVVQEILSPRAHFNYVLPDIHLSTLMVGVRADNLDILDLLLDRDTSIHKVPAVQCQLLEAASKARGCSFIRHLVDRGFDINATDCNGYGSALAVASAKGNLELVVYLLGKGAHKEGIGRGYEPSQLTESFGQYLTALQASLGDEIIDCHPEITELLLRSGADPNSSDRAVEDGGHETPLEIASKHCDVDVFRLLLDNGALPNLRVTCGTSTALLYAFQRGCLEVSKLLLETGAELSTSVRSAYDHPLVAALYGKELELIDLISRKMGDVPEAQCHPSTCAVLNRMDLIKVLLDMEASSVHHDTKISGLLQTMIVTKPIRDEACLPTNSMPETIKSLGHLPRDYGAAALAVAARERCVSLVQTLLIAGVRPCESHASVFAELDSRSYNAFEAFYRGFDQSWSNPKNGFDESQHAASTLILLIGACDSLTHHPHHKTSCKRALNEAFLKMFNMHRYSGEVPLFLAQAFVRAGVDVNFFTHRSQGSALQRAMMFCCSTDVVNYLIEAGAYVNVKSRVRRSDNSWERIAYHTPLQRAASTNSLKLVKLIVHHGAHVNAAPARRNGATALQFAAMRGNFEIFNHLLERGADINAPRSPSRGRTAIEGAAEHGRLDMVRYLLEVGADVQGKHNAQYRRAVYRAWKISHRALAKMIQDYKTRIYGAGDVCSIDEIMTSMTDEELDGRESDGWDSDDEMIESRED